MSKRKRTKVEHELDLIEIARLYIAGYSHWMIAQVLNEKNDYEITRAQVTYDINRVILKRWRESYLGDVDGLKARELARLDLLEKSAWESFEMSKAEKLAEETVNIEDSGDRPYKRVKNVTRKTQGDGNFMFLSTIQFCINKRIAIYGLAQPKTVNYNWKQQAAQDGVNAEEMIDRLTEEFLNAAQGKKPPFNSGGV